MNAKRKTFTGFDLILILVLLGAGIGLFLFQRSRNTGNTVRIWSDNELLAEFPLSQDREFIVATELGTNTVVIEHGQVSVTDADCPDKLCEKMGAISKPGETVICLPHRLVVEVSDEK